MAWFGAAGAFKNRIEASCGGLKRHEHYSGRFWRLRLDLKEQFMRLGFKALYADFAGKGKRYELDKGTAGSN